MANTPAHVSPHVSDLLARTSSETKSPEIEEEVSVIELRQQRDEIKSEVEELQKARDKETKTYKALKEKKKKIKNKYESTVWSRVDTERDLKKLEENLKIIDTKIEEAKQAATITTALQEKLKTLQLQLQQVTQNREQLQKQRALLEAKISSTHCALTEESTRASIVFHKKRYETNLLQQQFQSRKRISELVLKLKCDLQIIKQKAKEERCRRSNLETVTKIQFQQMQHLIRIACGDRKSIEKRLDGGITQHLELCGGFEDVEGNISRLLVNLDEGNKLSHVPHVNEIILTIGNHLDTIERINVEGNEASNDVKEEIKNLHHKIKEEHDAFHSLESRQTSITERLKYLDQQIQAMRKTRLDMAATQVSPSTRSPSTPDSSSRSRRKSNAGPVKLEHK